MTGIGKVEQAQGLTLSQKAIDQRLPSVRSLATSPSAKPVASAIYSSLNTSRSQPNNASLPAR